MKNKQMISHDWCAYWKDPSTAFTSPSFYAKAGNPEILAVKNARVPFDKFRDRLPLYGQRVASGEPTEPVEVSVISWDGSLFCMMLVKKPLF